MQDSEPRCCEYRAGDSVCLARACWVIAVGGEVLQFACDQHRNDLLARHEPKDVSGIYPLEDADEPPAHPSGQ